MEIKVPAERIANERIHIIVFSAILILSAILTIFVIIFLYFAIRYRYKYGDKYFAINENEISGWSRKGLRKEWKTINTREINDIINYDDKTIGIVRKGNFGILMFDIRNIKNEEFKNIMEIISGIKKRSTR